MKVAVKLNDRLLHHLEKLTGEIVQLLVRYRGAYVISHVLAISSELAVELDCTRRCTWERETLISLNQSARGTSVENHPTERGQ